MRPPPVTSSGAESEDIMDFNFSVQEYDRYMKRKYAEAIRNGETSASNELEYWEETTRPKPEPSIKPILAVNGKPIQCDGDLIYFSR
jgi:hypothetical protein